MLMFWASGKENSIQQTTFPFYRGMAHCVTIQAFNALISLKSTSPEIHPSFAFLLIKIFHNSSSH